jgi:hypothetical protein
VVGLEGLSAEEVDHEEVPRIRGVNVVASITGKSSDLEEVIAVIAGDLRVALELEEMRLLEQKELLTVIFEELDDSFITKSATDITETFTSSFVQDFVPTLNTAIS